MKTAKNQIAQYDLQVRPNFERSTSNNASLK